jgi:hypothetical protein
MSFFFITAPARGWGTSPRILSWEETESQGDFEAKTARSSKKKPFQFQGNKNISSGQCRGKNDTFGAHPNA